MGKHRHADGFTMIEMLLVLMIFCFLLLLFPMRQTHRHDLMMRMEQLKQLLLREQERSIQDLQTIHVEFDQTKMLANEKSYELGIQCAGSVIFHPNGNVDRAKTIICHHKGQDASLVIQLGSGRMYVKK